MSEQRKPTWLGRRVRRLTIRLGAAGALILLLAWMLSHLGGGGGGGGAAGAGMGKGSDSASSRPSPGGVVLTIVEPVEIVIHEDRYLDDGREMTTGQITAAAAGHTSPAVKIISGADSRVGAQRDLERALDAAHVSWTIESGPVTEP